MLIHMKKQILECILDLTDASNLIRIIQKVKPEEIYN